MKAQNIWYCETQKWLLNKIKLNHFYTEVICMVPHCPSVFVKISHYAHFREVWYTVIWISECKAPSIRSLANFELPLFNFAWVIFCLLAIDPWNAQINEMIKTKFPVCCWLILLLYHWGWIFFFRIFFLKSWIAYSWFTYPDI